MNAVLNIEIGFDLVCPWCLIGRRQLQSALARLRAEQPRLTVRLQWRGVQLLPDVPQAGVPFHEFYRRRLGGEAAMRQRMAQVQEAALAAGARIDYGAIEVMPNTADAHRLLAWAECQQDAARHDALLERLLRAYFEEGEDLGNPSVLLAHGEAAGFERGAMQGLLLGADVPLRPVGIGSGRNGVPFFAIGGAILLTGAQPAEALLEAMREMAGAEHQPS